MNIQVPDLSECLAPRALALQLGGDDVGRDENVPECNDYNHAQDRLPRKGLLDVRP